MSDSQFDNKRELDLICDQFMARWGAEGKAIAESLLDRIDVELPQQVLEQFLVVDVELRRKADETIVATDYQQFGDHAVSYVEGLLKGESWNESLVSQDVTKDFKWPGDESDDTLAPQLETSESESPGSIGRYQIESVLGKGGFGIVYKAYDEQLQRHVAIKVPHAHLVNNPADVDSYLTEARTVASLDHPNIVPVHDVGQSDEFPCYVVSRLIDGADLSNRMKREPLSIREAVELVGTIAEALHYAHKQGLVHRDVKPGNILLGKDGRSYLVDFGLALKEQKVGTGAEYTGTPAYMSPEQARGEGHRVDGRSDIYSLGCVLYELLVGQRTFHAESWMELLKKISSLEVKPPRQINDAAPRELERICLKAVSRRANDRYTTAIDLADDLRHFLEVEYVDLSADTQVLQNHGQEGQSSKDGIDGGTANFHSDSREIRVVPKGLRSFDSKDADFFLELLPGPRDRDGLPDSIRFWKMKIEETDVDETFAVGLIYGPSGCGKSSLVKAGLVPRLDAGVSTVYVEATPDETETRLLHGLRKVCPSLDPKLGLIELLMAIRQGLATPKGQKVLIVLDQFEQWLHAKKEALDTELVQALRQCDGGRLQCIVMVRDDFWMAATRFMRELEIRLLEGENSAAIDLFPVRHAEKVLIAVGRAFGALDSETGQLDEDQKQFITNTVAGLSEEGKVICVRLALFAEMMKGKPWTSKTLAEVGGTTGVGVTFLEETFTASTAPPEHRYHQKAARAVLKELLPESGTDIKGHMRSYAELLAASGFEARAKDFEDLIRILDSELRLITPTDPDGFDDEEEVASDPDQKYYQLTHDYLVPSLREWLTRKQKETRQGRAELILVDRAAVWNARPENRQLPGLWQWLQIRQYTQVGSWNEPQRTMMGRASIVHGLRMLLACATVFVVFCGGLMMRNQINRAREATRIDGLVDQLVSAEPNQIPKIVLELDKNPEAADTYLKPLLTLEAERRAQLHARLAQVGRDPALVDPLVEELLGSKVIYVLPIRQMLRPWAATLTGKFREVLRKDEDPQRRFRAALALADDVPRSEPEAWTDVDLNFVAEQLVSSNAEYHPLLREALRPICNQLLPALERVFTDAEATEAQRLGAANALADYAAEDIERLANLLTFATAEQFSVLYPMVITKPTPDMINKIAKIAAESPPDDLGTIERIAFGQRRANAAVTLLRMGELEKVLDMFAWTDDPEACTQFVFRCRDRNVGIGSLLECLDVVRSAPMGRYPADTRSALLLTLGEFQLDEIPKPQRENLLSQIADWYANDPSSGVHGASGWLLRHWDQTETVRKIEQTVVPYSPDREWFTLAITVTPTSSTVEGLEKGNSPKQNADNEGDASSSGGENAAGDVKVAVREQSGTASGVVSQESPEKTFHYTFVVFPAGEYWIGSVTDDPDQLPEETRHQVKLTRTFAVLDREITFEELIAFSPEYRGVMQQNEKHVASPDAAGFYANWYESIRFSRWLGKQMGLSEDQQAYASLEPLDKKVHSGESDPDPCETPPSWPVDLGKPGFRLPTDSEWEVVARSGSRTIYGFGSDVDLLGRFGWVFENSDKKVHPPRERRPNSQGIFDIHGNLYEWTHDCYRDYKSEKITDPRGPKSGDVRVRRGGSWYNQPAGCRTAGRSATKPTVRSYTIGIRLALSLTFESTVAEKEQAELEAENGSGLR